MGDSLSFVPLENDEVHLEFLRIAQSPHQVPTDQVNSSPQVLLKLTPGNNYSYCQYFYSSSLATLWLN